MTKYEKGKRWGWAIFKKNIDSDGKNIGCAKSDKAYDTCNQYAHKGKKNGKQLSEADKDFYRGACDGFQEYYNKHFG